MIREGISSLRLLEMLIANQFLHLRVMQQGIDPQCRIEWECHAYKIVDTHMRNGLEPIPGAV